MEAIDTKLDARLLAVAELVLPGQVAADIGADHGLLARHLVSSGRCPRVIASEKTPGPYANLLRLSNQADLAGRIETRLGDGLSVLRPGEAATIILAGMGGRLMLELLAAAPQVTAAATRLVLQPQKNVDQVRAWLTEHGWRIAAEELAQDSGFYYTALAAEQGQQQLSPVELVYGPCLLAQPHPLLAEYLSSRRLAVEALLRQVEQQSGPTARRRCDQLRREAQQLELATGLSERRGGSC